MVGLNAQVEVNRKISYSSWGDAVTMLRHHGKLSLFPY